MDDAAPAYFGSVLRRLRLAAHLSQEKLAERAQLSVETVSALERGARRAPYRTTVDLLTSGLALGAADRALLTGAARRGRGPRVSGSRLPPSPPAYLTSFIDRERERGELADLGAHARLITICGPGGVGKTRLALEVAGRARGGVSRVRFVGLASVRDPALVGSQIAAALAIDDVGAERGLDPIIAVLRRGPHVLVFDNCEHLIEACAHAIEAIVRACPSVMILATSREPLLLDGEHVYRLEPFSDARAAMQLFSDRARSVAPAVDLRTNSATVAQITDRLAGIPLAIELAAALIRTQDLSEIDTMLAGTAFLTHATRRTAVEHQRTMEATLAWSYALLNDTERGVLRVLAYPPAGTPVATLGDVCGFNAGAHVARLIDASLVVTDPLSGHLTLHAMTRQFVTRATAAEEIGATARRFAASIGSRMRAAFAVGWRTSSYAVYEPLTGELDNVRQAWDWALLARDLDLARELAGAPDYWTAIGRTPEGFRRLTRIDAELGLDGEDPRDATVLFGIALCAAQSGLAAEARAPGRRAAELARRHGATLIEARCAVALGNSLLVAGDPRGAEASLIGATQLFESLDDVTGRARALSFRALALVERGECDEAGAVLDGVVRLHAEMPAPVGAADEVVVEMLLGDIARLRGDIETALDRSREAVTLLGEGHRTWIHLRALHQYVDTLIVAGDLAQAVAVAAPELERLHERGFTTDVALLIERLAIVLVRFGRFADAARAAGFAEATLSAAGRRRMSFDRRVRATLIDELAAHLADTELDALQLDGRAETARAMIGTLAEFVPIAPAPAAREVTP